MGNVILKRIEEVGKDTQYFMDGGLTVVECNWADSRIGGGL